MRASQAKLIRRLAGVGKSNVVYDGKEKPKVYTVSIKTDTWRVIKGIPRVMADCPRKLYKQMKREFYAR